MRIFFALLALLFGISGAFGTTVHEYSIDLYYANGVLAKDQETLSFFWLTKSKELKSQNPTLRQALKFGEAKLAYNESHLRGAIDFGEVFDQYLKDQASDGIGWSDLWKYIVAEILKKTDIVNVLVALGKITSTLTLQKQMDAYIQSVKSGHGVIIAPTRISKGNCKVVSLRPLQV